MKTSRPTAVFRANWAPYALAVVDAIHAMHAGTPPAEASAAAQASFEKMLAE